MTPMLLARYAEDGSQKARRHMLAMGQSDPEILADVLGHFVRMASERIEDVSCMGFQISSGLRLLIVFRDVLGQI